MVSTSERLRAELQSDLRLESGETPIVAGAGLRVVPAPPTPSVRFVRGKRAVDVLFAASVLVLASPLFLVILLAVKLTSRGPALYRCERIGRNGKPFRCLKFRTMIADADKSLHLILRESAALSEEFERHFKLCRDPRITRVGRFLRRISLDELPQFWNVLAGDMSVVGWRPIVTDEIRRYGDVFPFVASLRPGITGLWQVSGRNDVSYDERVHLDVEYTSHPSLRADLSIMGRTVGQLLRWWDNGAY